LYVSAVPSRGYQVAHLSELERLPAFGEQAVWRPIRHHFGIEAFGINAYTGDRVGERVIEEHTEEGSGAGAHQELYVVLSGVARFTVGEDEFDVPAGTFVFLPEPMLRRGAVAAAPETTVLAVGGRAGEPYAVSAWEYAFLGLAKRGPEGLESLEDGIEHYPDRASLRYNLARLHALEGRREEALEALTQATQLDPQIREWAVGDEDFASLRGDPEFESLITT
jgi:tetratricopeptide (TPR) repeat protein